MSDESLKMQQLEAMSRLTGSVAHEFNNLVSVILGYADLLLQQFPDRAPGREFMEEIQRAGERASWLNRQLLTFTRKQVLKTQPHDLNAFLAEMDGILRRFLGADIELVTVWAPDLRPIRADLAQLEQVVMSLALIARGAMPRGGKFVLETYEEPIPGPAGARTGAFVVLSVSHTGKALDPEVRQRLSQARFAADAAAGQLDLGLAAVADIVAKHQGRLEVDSEPGRGTTFRLLFPALEGDLSLHARPSWIDSGPCTETILVADDEHSLRTMIRHLLEPEGYTVLDAGHGAQAVATGKEHRGSIHLLLVDVVMAQVNGLQVAERLAQLRPGLRVLFFSGVVDASAVPERIGGQPAFFLQKPFTRRALLQNVRAAIETPIAWED